MFIAARRHNFQFSFILLFFSLLEQLRVEISILFVRLTSNDGDSINWSSMDIASCCIALQLAVSFFTRSYFSLLKFRFVHKNGTSEHSSN